jgi:hypothetical protein
VSPARGPPTEWTELVQNDDDRDVMQASTDELTVIDIHALEDTCEGHGRSRSAPIAKNCELRGDIRLLTAVENACPPLIHPDGIGLRLVRHAGGVEIGDRDRKPRPTPQLRDDRIPHRDLEVVAKPSLASVYIRKVFLDDPHEKLLENIVGLVAAREERITVATDRRTISRKNCSAS